MTSPSQLADHLHATATDIAQHGERTNRTVHEWANSSIGSGANGPSGKGDHSDPTFAAVQAAQSRRPHDPATLAEPWDAAILWLQVIIGAPLPPSLRSFAKMVTKGQAKMLWTPAARHCDTVRRTIAQATPISAEYAREILDAEHTLVMRARDCQACESPSPQLRSGLCDACRQLWSRNPEMAEDLTTFCTWVARRVAEGSILRPASPFTRIAKHEAEHETERTETA